MGWVVGVGGCARGPPLAHGLIGFDNSTHICGAREMSADLRGRQYLAPGSERLPGATHSSVTREGRPTSSNA